jgi:hypothetical protein
MFSLGGKMKSIGARSKVKEVSDDKGRLSNFIEVSRWKVLLLLRTAVLTPLPPGGMIKL